MVKINFNFILRVDFTKKNGESPIYLRLTQNQKKKDISINLSVDKKYWDPKKQEIRNAFPEKQKELTVYKNRVRKIYQDALYNDESINIIDFAEKFSSGVSSESFSEYILNYLKSVKHKIADETYRTYKSQITKILQFKNPIGFNQVSESLVNNYEKWMYQKNNNKVTIAKSLSMLRTFARHALRENYIKEDPFKNIKIQHGVGKREYLTLTELQKLEAIFTENDLQNYKKNVLQYFLFCCYTGLRFSDIKNLKRDNINEGVMNLRMHKTEREIYIPLPKKAINLLPENETGKNIFKVITNQKTNTYLSDIMSKAGINKKISFHCARHTFATVSIELGIPLEVIQSILGHSSVKTTQIYAKIVSAVKTREMDKWNTI